MSKSKYFKIPPQFKENLWNATNPNNQTPCPMLNTLANYGILPKKNITSQSIKTAMQKLICCDELSILILRNVFQNSFSGFTKSLNDIGKHGVIEHDCSLTRKDFHIGDSIRFNKKQFNKMKSFSKDGKYLTLEELANYAVYQRKQCEKDNPKIDFGMNQMFGSIAEQSALYLLFKDDTGKIRMDWITYFFTKEKLPFKKGFVLNNQLNMFDIIQTITKLLILENIFYYQNYTDQKDL
jgi:hypothetical protein